MQNNDLELRISTSYFSIDTIERLGQKLDVKTDAFTCEYYPFTIYFDEACLVPWATNENGKVTSVQMLFDASSGADSNGSVDDMLKHIKANVDKIDYGKLALAIELAKAVIDELHELHELHEELRGFSQDVTG
jgi:hypothetical protein